MSVATCQQPRRAILNLQKQRDKGRFFYHHQQMNFKCSRPADSLILTRLGNMYLKCAVEADEMQKTHFQSCLCWLQGSRAVCTDPNDLSAFHLPQLSMHLTSHIALLECTLHCVDRHVVRSDQTSMRVRLLCLGHTLFKVTPRSPGKEKIMILTSACMIISDAA